jgi:DNA (cytosine-5)-methyltransferase 1
MKHGSLFSGIGGFDLAAHWMGWENAFHCEWMEFPRKVLDYYFPEADSHVDICKTDFKKYEGNVDIITGGFPCQPFSMAGKRKGSEDERYLWHEMLRTIQEVKPKYVIAENVLGLTNIEDGLVFEQVWSDLEVAGYEVQPFVLPAASKGAPHQRQRIWIIAYRSGLRFNPGRSEQSLSGNSSNGNEGNTTNTKCKGLQSRTKSREIQSQKGIMEKQGYKSSIESTTSTNKWNVTDTDLSRFKTKGEQSKPTTQNKRIEYSSSRWEQFPTQPAICGGDDGLPRELDGITFSKWRNQSIKGYGNAIVPQVALELFKVIQEIDNQLI